MIPQKMSRTPIPSRPRPRGLRRIVVALDGTSIGETVLRHLREFLGPRQVVVLIHVLPDSGGDREPDAVRYLKDVQLRFPQFRSRWIVETGDPAERIVDAARDEDADALAMTTHARGSLVSLLMGSVARGVVRRAEKPVFLVRPGVTPPRRAGRRILVPLAEFPGAEPVPAAVESLARETNAEVRLVHVLPFPRIADPVTGFNPAVFRPIQLPAVPWLDDCVNELTRREIRATKRVLAGVPDEAILREGREENVDLIALETRGRGGLTRLVLGSVTEAVLKRADRAVLVCHRVEPGSA
jgi:nucleotide-binding universal stress UspA family protein